MAGLKYFQYHIGDRSIMTRMMNFEQKGILSDAIDTYLSTGEPLTEKWVSIAKRMSSDGAVDFVLDMCFVKDGDVYRNAWCDQTIADFEAMSARASSSAKARWSKANKGGSGNAGGVQSNSDSKSTAVQSQSEGNAVGCEGYAIGMRQQCDRSATACDSDATPVLTNKQINQETKIDSTPTQEAKKTRKVEPKTVFLSCPSSDHLCEDWREQLCQRRPDLALHAEAIFFDFKDYWTKGEGRSEKRTADGWRRTWLNNLKKARVPTIPYEKPAGTLPIPPEQQAKIDAERAAGKVYVPKPVIVPKPKTDKLWGVNEDLPDEPPFEPEDIPAQEHKPIDDGRPSWCPTVEICGDDDFSDGDDDDDRECRSDYHWEDRDPANLDAETEPIDPALEACFKANFKGLL